MLGGWGRMRTAGSVSAATILLAVLSASAETVMIDNNLTGFSVLSGTWTTSPAVSPYNPGYVNWYGQDYRYKATSATVSGQVEWRPTLTAGGEYEVSVWYYSQGSASPNNAHYVVYHSAGATDVYINQQMNGSRWVSLGRFMFDAGTGGRVTLNDQAQVGKTIMADAVRFQTTAPASPEFRAAWVDVFHEGMQNKDPGRCDDSKTGRGRLQRGHSRGPGLPRQPVRRPRGLLAVQHRCPLLLRDQHVRAVGIHYRAGASAMASRCIRGWWRIVSRPPGRRRAIPSSPVIPNG